MQSDRNTFYGNASSQNIRFMSSLELINCGNPCFSVVHDFVVCLQNNMFYANMINKYDWLMTITHKDGPGNSLRYNQIGTVFKDCHFSWAYNKWTTNLSMIGK